LPDHGVEQALRLVAARLALLDPTNLLRRGWSITHAADGTLVRSVADLSAGAELITRLADGEIVSHVHHTEVEQP